MHTCLQADMHPSMDEVLLLLRPCIFPSPNESSNAAPVFGKCEAHIEVYSGAPFP